MNPRHPRRTTWRRLPVAALLLAVIAACGGGGVEGGGQATDTGGAAAPTGTGTGGGAETGGEAAEGEPLKIGMATTLSGAIALFGEANRNAAQLAIDQLNEAGGVLGRPLELIVQDDTAEPEVGAQLARDLIIGEEVDLLLGPVSSGVALAINEVANERDVPIIYHTSNTEALTLESFHEHSALVVPNTGMEARAQAVDLAESEYTRWATIAPNYEFGQRQTATFVETLTELNPDVEIVEQQFPELGESDQQPFIASILSAEPDAVYSPLFAGDLVTFTPQAFNLGLFEQVYFTALYETDALQELGDEFDLEGIRAYSRCPFNIDTPQMAEFVTAYQEAVGEVPSDWACMAYDAVMLWAQVSEEAGSAEPDAFAETIGGFEFTSLRGDTYIRDIDHQAAVPSYIGELTLDEELGFYVYSNIEAVPGEEIWLSEEEVQAGQGG